ncbi:MAG: hypothetical protein ACLPH3_14120 [Terracidiphilus sp.]
MKTSEQYRKDLQSALDEGALQRLPITFLPFVNQQLAQWEYLFPNERQSVKKLLHYVADLSPDESSALFKDVIQLEEKMGVRHWRFSTNEQTIENSSELARSPYFQEWRRAVQAVFDAVDQHALPPKNAEIKARHRLVLLDIPPVLPLNASTVWQRWQSIGKPMNLERSELAGDQSFLGFLLMPSAGGPSHGLLDVDLNRPESSPADTWVLDAGAGLVDVSGKQYARENEGLSLIVLSCKRLDSFRQNFSREMNTMRKDLADADAVFDRLRKVDVTPWCPPEFAADPAVREFVRSLFLSGNGAVLFGNSFVEWGASEAFRRARPSMVAARFGVRAKPKAFTGVAVFDNPDQVNPTPSVDDFSGSAVDAEILALYIWLAATRYAEYQSATVCVVLAESISQAYVIAPPEFSLRQSRDATSLSSLRGALCEWMA